MGTEQRWVSFSGNKCRWRPYEGPTPLWAVIINYMCYNGKGVDGWGGQVQVFCCCLPPVMGDAGQFWSLVLTLYIQEVLCRSGDWLENSDARWFSSKIDAAARVGFCGEGVVEDWRESLLEVGSCAEGGIFQTKVLGPAWWDATMEQTSRVGLALILACGFGLCSLCCPCLDRPKLLLLTVVGSCNLVSAEASTKETEVIRLPFSWHCFHFGSEIIVETSRHRLHSLWITSKGPYVRISLNRAVSHV